MIFNWYKIFNLTEFEALGLVSRTYKLTLNGIGEKEILVTKGNSVNVLYGDAFMPVNFYDYNPFIRGGYAVYKDAETDDVYLGILVEA